MAFAAQIYKICALMKAHAKTNQQSHYLALLYVILHMSREMEFPTMWHFDKPV